MARPLSARPDLLVGSILLALAGCSLTDQSDSAPTDQSPPPPSESQTATGKPSESQTATAEPSESQTATVEPDSSPRWPTLTEVDPSGVPGLSTYTVSDNEQQLHIVVPQLQSHQTVSSHLQEMADDAGATYLADYAAPPDEAGDLTTWQSSTWAATAVSAASSD